MDGWPAALVVYAAAAVITFVPVARNLLMPVTLHPGGDSFADSQHFSPAAQTALTQHYSRIQGTLSFWKLQAAKYKSFHTYSLIWITISTVSVPFLAQAVSADKWSKWLLTIVGAYAALLFALVRAFRVEANYKAFRHGESEFYDTYRRMLDLPGIFWRNGAGTTPKLF
jgi:hypothetical protein